MNTSNYIRSFTILSFCLGLSACGGGGDDADTASTPEAPVTVVEDEPEAPNDTDDAPSNIPDALKSLSVADDFTLSNEMKVDLLLHHTVATSLSQSVAADTQYHLNLCTEWKDEQKQRVNYNSCLWRGSFSKETLQLHLAVPGHQSQLIAELWTVQGGSFEVAHKVAAIEAKITLDF